MNIPPDLQKLGEGLEQLSGSSQLLGGTNLAGPLISDF